MRLTHSKLIAAATAGALIAGGAGAAFAVAGGGDQGENSRGPGAELARAAALSLLEGGTANSVERDSENGATWEVEVTRADGRTVDVRLDDSYELVVIEGDMEDRGGR